MRRWLLLLGIVLFPLLVAPSPGYAQDGSSLSMAVSALYDGTVKYGEWLPVQVTLSNQGSDTRGRVQIARAGSGNSVLYAQEIELPAGARKAVTVHTISSNFTRRLQVEFWPEGAGEPALVEEVQIKPVPNINFMVATISGGGAGLQPLSTTEFRSGVRDDTVALSLDLVDLPDRPEALRTLDMIVLAGIDSRTMTPRQQHALEQFVSLGGVLVLGGGGDAARVLGGLPESIQPVVIEGQQMVESLDTLGEITGEPVRVNGPFPLAEGRPVAGAEIRRESNGTPLVVERNVGDGVVIWLALDPALSPFDAWAGTGGFWQWVVGSHAAYPVDLPPDVSPRQVANDQLGYALQNLPSLDLPSLRLLIPLLGLYIVVVGPLTYLVLRRTRRLELAWLSIPLVTVLFSLGAYGLGFGLRGSDVILNQITVIQGAPGSDGGYMRSMVGLFSPTRRSYTMAISGEPLLSPSSVFSDPFGGGAFGPLEATLIQGEPARVTDMMVNQWSMQSVMAEAVVDEGYGVESTLQLADGRVTGSITNRGTKLWKDVVVVVGQDFERLGDIAPGRSVELSLRAAADPNQFGPDISWRIYQENSFNDRTAQIRQQVVSSLYNNPFSGRVAQSEPFYPRLLAWVDGGALEVEIEGVPLARTVGTTLYTVDLPLGFAPGTVQLPQGMVGSEMLRSGGHECYGASTLGITSDASEAEFRFTLPSALRTLEPSEMTLHLTNQGGWFVAPEMALFNHERNEWEALVDPILGRNTINEPDRFVSGTGEIRLLVTNEGQRGGGCLFFDISLEGEYDGPAAEVGRGVSG